MIKKLILKYHSFHYSKNDDGNDDGNDDDDCIILILLNKQNFNFFKKFAFY